MNKRTREVLKKTFAVLCACIVVTALVASVFLPVVRAATQKQLNDAKNKTQEAKTAAQKAEAEKKAAINSYNALDSQIQNTENEIDTLEKQIEQTKKDIVLKEEELKLAEEQLKSHEEAFMARAGAMYEHNDIKYVELLFKADSLSDFLTKIDMITQIMEYDNKVLTDLKETREKINLAKKQLEDILVRQEDDSKKLETKRQSLSAALAEKEKLMKEAIKNADRYKAIYEAAERAEQALIRENANAFSQSGYNVKYTGGRFAWPVPGSHRITSQYGERIHPVYKTRKFHSGIDIGAGYGLDIVAAADGKVTLATTNGGYGKCVVINHGSGITTLYGHCSSMLVSAGDTVTKGQVIAKVGSTGVSTGPHLHFEVRINGATTNPLNYVS